MRVIYGHTINSYLDLLDFIKNDDLHLKTRARDRGWCNHPMSKTKITYFLIIPPHLSYDTSSQHTYSSPSLLSFRVRYDFLPLISLHSYTSNPSLVFSMDWTFVIFSNSKCIAETPNISSKILCSQLSKISSSGSIQGRS